MNARDLAAVAAGGAIGAVARYEISDAWPVSAGQFPTTTFVINLAGAFLLGMLLEVLTRRDRFDHWGRFLLGIGALGAFTTFSTFATELVLLTRDGHGGVAVAYAVVSVIGGVLATLAGLWCAGWRHTTVPDEGES